MTYDVYMPVRCIYGKDAVTENSSLFKGLGSRCLIVTGKHAAKASGALDDACKALEKEGIAYAVFDEITANPLLSSCRKAGEKAREINADFILGIGGGSPQDSCKAIAIYATNPDLSELDIYKRVYNNPPLPVALIGTTAGTGSEVTAVSVLTNDETGVKKSIKGPDCYAKISFCDPKYTYSVPLEQTISTALDAFAHAAEGFFTAKCEGIERLYAEKCIPSLYSCLKALAQGDEITEDLRDELYYGSIYAGLVINTCGTAFPHPMGYVLTENYGVLHGTACAAFYSPFLDRCAEFSPEKAKCFFEMTDEKEKVKSLIASLTHISGIKMSPEEAHKYSERWASVTPGNFLASPGSLTREEAEAILNELFG
jgi:alcohol dehydrogenase class IV